MIRKLEENDIPVCVAIAREAGAGGRIERYLNEQFTLHEDSVFMIEFYVYEENGIIKGLGGLCNSLQDYQTYTLFTCYVKTEFQGQGIGKALTEFRINRIRELKGQLVFSSTYEPWHLERFGFKKLETPYNTAKEKPLIPMQLNLFYDK